MSWATALDAVNTACRNVFGDAAIHTAASSTGTNFEFDSNGTTGSGRFPVTIAPPDTFDHLLAAMQAAMPDVTSFEPGDLWTFTPAGGTAEVFEATEGGAPAPGNHGFELGVSAADAVQSWLNAMALVYPGMTEFADGDVFNFLPLAGGGRIAPQTIKATYSEAYLALDADGNKLSVESRNAWVRVADCTTRPRQRDRLEILEGQGVGTYEISDVHTDGGGGLTLVLCEVPA